LDEFANQSDSKQPQDCSNRSKSAKDLLHPIPDNLPDPRSVYPAHDRTCNAQLPLAFPDIALRIAYRGLFLFSLLFSHLDLSPSFKSLACSQKPNVTDVVL
jgi:hypothetical protein